MITTTSTVSSRLTLHDALPISRPPDGRGVRDHEAAHRLGRGAARRDRVPVGHQADDPLAPRRSEVHTSELQSPCKLVCRLLLEKNKQLDITKIQYPAFL